MVLVRLHDGTFDVGLEGIAMSNTTPAVIGYSERGMVNALVGYLRRDTARVAGFLDACRWTWQQSGRQAPDDWKLKRLRDQLAGGDGAVQYLVETGFAQFGDPDLIVVIKHDGERSVFFVEAKVVSYEDSAKPRQQGMTKQPGFNSCINGQLSLRYRLARALADYTTRAAWLVEPTAVYHRARAKDAAGVADVSPRPRALKKHENMEYLVPLLVGHPKVPAAETFLSNAYFVALTHEPALCSSLPRTPAHPKAPPYFARSETVKRLESEPATRKRENDVAELAWTHTGICTWSALESVMTPLRRDPDYRFVRTVLGDPVLRGPCGGAGHRTLTTKAWTKYPTTPWIAQARKWANDLFRHAAGGVPSTCDFALRALAGSDSWTANGDVVAKVLAYDDGGGVKLLVGLACDHGHRVPSSFPEDAAVGEQLLNGRRFRFASVGKERTAGQEDVLRAALEEFTIEVANAR